MSVPALHIRLDRAQTQTTLAEVHTSWGDLAWNDGDIKTAVTHWLAAARYAKAAKEGL